MVSKVKGNLGIADVIGDKRTKILELARRYGASHVRVFGSVARGEARPDSDVDLLISFPHDQSIFELVELWQELGDLLHKSVDLSTDDTIKDYVREVALRDAITL